MYTKWPKQCYQNQLHKDHTKNSQWVCMYGQIKSLNLSRSGHVSATWSEFEGEYCMGMYELETPINSDTLECQMTWREMLMWVWHNSWADTPSPPWSEENWTGIELSNFRHISFCIHPFLLSINEYKRRKQKINIYVTTSFTAKNWRP